MNQKQAGEAIAEMEDFTASALRGKWEAYSVDAGRLDPEEAEQLHRSQAKGLLYIVYSYRTPIAWRDLEGWYIVEQKFSCTTSRHQGIVRRALADAPRFAGVK